jgi:hypothetical protein
MALQGEKPASMAARRTVHRSPFTVHEKKPWYRHPWPWLLFAGPAVVAVAGSVTIWLAISSSDGLVADDYYKRGLAINRVLARDRRAASLGVRATVSQDANGGLRVALSGGASLPPALTVQLIHPTRAGHDRTLVLRRAARGIYRSGAVPVPAGRRYVILGDEAGSWRLTGEWTLPAARPLELVPRSDGGAS